MITAAKARRPKVLRRSEGNRRAFHSDLRPKSRVATGQPGGPLVRPRPASQIVRQLSGKSDERQQRMTGG